ncbi:IclR family transcriptional regulator [Granulicoccus sp. GXG6511]|uniref:IclR family transcriptional regulator n=1 Tax=Granulicoccus sp. GXG6511 TaxID=3381351 RepID=UPI003D7E4B09
MANSSSGDSIVERVARILEAFDGSTLVMTVAELGRRADLPSTTAHRLVDELVATGLLDRRGREVQLGLRLWELTERSSGLFALREAARPHLENLRDRLQHHVYLGVLNRHEVLYVDRLTTEKSTVNITKIAARLPAHASSAGYVLMAHASAEAQDAFLNSRFTRYTSDTVTDPNELRRILAQVRQQGFAVAVRAIVTPSSGIAVPIENSVGEVVAALGIVVPVGEESLRATLPALKTASAEITSSIRTAAPGLTARTF